MEEYKRRKIVCYKQESTMVKMESESHFSTDNILQNQVFNIIVKVLEYPIQPKNTHFPLVS